MVAASTTPERGEGARRAGQVQREVDWMRGRAMGAGRSREGRARGGGRAGRGVGSSRGDSSAGRWCRRRNPNHHRRVVGLRLPLFRPLAPPGGREQPRRRRSRAWKGERRAGRGEGSSRGGGGAGRGAATEVLAGQGAAVGRRPPHGSQGREPSDTMRESYIATVNPS
jgi:hypothetical protein